MADVNDNRFELNEIQTTGRFGDVVANLNSNFRLIIEAILKKRDGKSAYELWVEQPGNEGKTLNEFFASLKESGFTSKAVLSLPTGSEISENTIYAVPEKSDESLQNPDRWAEYIRKDNSWILLAQHTGAGLASIITDIASLQSRNEPIVFTESKEMNSIIKRLFIDASGTEYAGEDFYIQYYVGQQTGAKYCYISSNGTNIIYLPNLEDGVICGCTQTGVYYYIELTAELPSTGIANTKLLPEAFSPSSDPRITDGGYTHSPIVNKYIKKLLIEFTDNYTLPSGYSSIEDVKNDFCLYSLNNNNIVDGLYKPKLYFRLKGGNSQILQYDNSDGEPGEINLTNSAGIRLQAVVDWEGLKGKRYTGMWMPLNPISFDAALYHDRQQEEKIEELKEVKRYFDGGTFPGFVKEELTNDFSRGYIATTKDAQINYTVNGLNGYFWHQVIDVSNDADGVIYRITGRNGTSGKLAAKVNDGVVTQIYDHGLSYADPATYDILIDGTFDTLVFNVDTRLDYRLLKLTPTTIERKPLIEEIDELKEAIEGGGGSEHTARRSIKTLHFGNSFTQDSFSYLPPILKEIAPDLDFTIMIAIIGGSPLAQHCANFTGQPQTIGSITYNVADYSCAVFTQDDASWRNISSLKTVDSILAYTDWDVVTFQQLSGQSYGDWDTYFKPFIYKIHESLYSKISALQGIETKRVKLGWLLTHGKGNTFSGSKTQWQGVVANTQKILNMTATEVVFPYGTAIQNLRTKSELNALGDTGGLLADGTHLHEGIAPLCAAYANCLTLLHLAGYKNISVLGEKMGVSIDAAWIDTINVQSPNPARPNVTVVGISSSNMYLAQAAAIAAIKKPFSLSFDADGESDNGVTLDDLI